MQKKRNALLLALCLLTGACRRPPAPKEPPVQGVPANDGAAATGPRPSDGSGPPSFLCTATPNQKFHLRKTASRKAKGKLFPSGTRLVLLEETEIARMGARLFKVRLVETTNDPNKAEETGYAFVNQKELGPDCEVSWEDDLNVAKLPPNPPLVPGGECLVAKPVKVKKRDALIDQSCKDEEDGHKHDPEELDLNGDGTQDALLTAVSGSQEHFILAIHGKGKDGWTGYTVGQGSSDADHAQTDWSHIARTKLGIYVGLCSAEHYDSAGEEPDRDANWQGCELFRVLGDGSVLKVFQGEVEGGAESEWRFQADGEDSLILMGSSGRVQRLRWDPLARRLVPQRMKVSPKKPKESR